MVAVATRMLWKYHINLTLLHLFVACDRFREAKQQINGSNSITTSSTTIAAIAKQLTW
jgi:hypothetical protein